MKTILSSMKRRQKMIYRLFRSKRTRKAKAERIKRYVMSILNINT